MRPTSKISVPRPTSRSTISNKPRIAITWGDPAGIGPEILEKALKDPRVHRACEPIVAGKRVRVSLGRPSREGGMAALASLQEGLRLVQSGNARALVTAPVSKEAFRMADHGFPGHTEWLAEICGRPDAAMLMVSGPLRAILMTRHLPLAEVSSHLDPNLITLSARLGHEFVRRYVGEPKLVLCGLNPHAGDHGLIGQEEMTIFRPTLAALKKEKIAVEGPLPADSVFPQMAKGRFNLALAAYHDQGMIPLKLFGPHRVVNITLGLPFIRTSPGHGTAYDIAGKKVADPRPMVEAILLAARYAK